MDTCPDSKEVTGQVPTPPAGGVRVGRVTPMRSDAEENRARILAAAAAALAESSDATLNSIARRAGVGQGAVYRQDVQAVIDAAPALLAAHPPAEALRQWFGRLASYGRIKHGVAEAVQAATRADLSSAWYGPVTEAITQLLRAGQAAGEIRPDVDADEVLLLVGFLWRIGNDGWEKRAAHLLDLVMDGLRA